MLYAGLSVSASVCRWLPYENRRRGEQSGGGTGKAGTPGRAWISRLGDDEFGRYVQNAIRAEGVDTESVRFDGEHPTGVMFKEKSCGETSVYYYRKNSAAAAMSPLDLDEEDFRSAKMLHLTGITPVLSQSCRDAVFYALDLAERFGLDVSFDPNIRRKLWGGRGLSSITAGTLQPQSLSVYGKGRSACAVWDIGTG